MNLSFTSGIKNHQKFHVISSVTHEWKFYIQNDSNERYVTVEF